MRVHAHLGPPPRPRPARAPPAASRRQRIAGPHSLLQWQGAVGGLNTGQGVWAIITCRQGHLRRWTRASLRTFPAVCVLVPGPIVIVQPTPRLVPTTCVHSNAQVAGFGSRTAPRQSMQDSLLARSRGLTGTTVPPSSCTTTASTAVVRRSAARTIAGIAPAVESAYRHGCTRVNKLCMLRTHAPPQCTQQLTRLSAHMCQSVTCSRHKVVWCLRVL